MLRRPPRSTRTDTLFPYTALFRSVFAVCGNRGMRCDVRFMAATNRDVSPESDGPLRDDLFYRLCVGYVHVPPLRGRPGQIRKLVNVFVAEQNHCQCRQVVGFDARALELLLEYEIGRAHVCTPVTNAHLV